MKKFTKDIKSVLAALTAGVAAVPGTMMLQGSTADAEADTDAVAETTTYVSRTMAVPGSYSSDDNAIEEQERPVTEATWDIVGDMAPPDECTVTEIPSVENIPVGGMPLVSDELIPDIPAVTDLPPLAGEPLPPDNLIPELPDETEMPPFEGGMTVDDLYVPDENGRKLSMITVYVSGDIDFKHFLIEEYQPSLISEGMTEEEADAKCMSVYNEYISRGIITNAKIKSAYESYLYDRFTEAAADEVYRITSDRSREFEISYDYPAASSVKIKLRLSDEEFGAAESCYDVLNAQNTEEIIRYGRKLDDKKTVQAIRRGDETIPVSVYVKYSVGFMSEDEAASFFRNLSGVTGPVIVEKGADSAYFSAEAAPGQIELLASHDIVKSIGYTNIFTGDGRQPAEANPTTVPADFTVSGDINSDGKTDLTDLSELSLALVGDKVLTESQQKAADVDGDGEVKLTDLAKLRQYISKVIDKL